MESNSLVKITDKHFSIAVVSKAWYKEQFDKHLSSDAYNVGVDDTYEATIVIAREMQIIESLPRNKFLKRFLALQPAPRILGIHDIPKIHKNPWSLRPIIPCHSSFITGVAKVLEAHNALYLPSYSWIINSTKGFVQEMEKVRYITR